MRASRPIALALSLAPYAPTVLAQEAAQGPPPATYVVLHYMKVAPGKAEEYLRLEQQVWKPVHQDRVKSKEMVGWRLYAVPYTADPQREYDYVTANIYDNVAATEGNGLLEVFQRRYTAREATANLAKTGAARQMVRAEVWRLVEQTVPRSPASSTAVAPRYLTVDYMRSKPGGNYVAVERDIWKPIHQERLASGMSGGWSLYSLVLPGGTSYPYDYATVNALTSLSALTDPYTEALFKKVHPNVPMTEIGSRTTASRDLTRRELWVLVDATR